MTRTIADDGLEIQAFKPGASSPFVTIPGDDVREVSIDERAQDAKDSGRITLDALGGRYASSDPITSGDKLVVRVRLEGETSLSDRWTAIVRSPEDTLEGGQLQTRTLPCEDFVFTVLSWRKIYETFDGAPIAGSSDAILDTLLTAEAPEIDQSRIGSFAETSDGFYNGRELLSIVTDELAPIADAVVYNDGESLVFEPLADVSATHPLTPADFRGSVSITRNDDDLANLIRVDGGTDHASDDEQPTQTAYQRVTDGSRLTTQVQTRKSEVARVAVHTRADSSSPDGIVVRLQADRDGSPVDVTDQQSDIVRKTLAQEFIANDGHTTFILPAHTLAPRENPWLIVEADGSTGHEIGVDSNGVPRYRAEYPYPLLSRLPREQSQDEYRRRDDRIKDESLDSELAVRDKARSIARHNDQPAITVKGAAQTLRAHRLAPGEAVDMQDWTPRAADVSGTFLVSGRETTFDGGVNRLTTNLVLQDVDTI